MSQVGFAKVVSALPSSLDPDTLYFVRVGSGFDVYLTNTNATPSAFSLNAPSVVIGGYPVNTSGLSVGDVLSFTGSGWTNISQGNITDGGNF